MLVQTRYTGQPSLLCRREGGDPAVRSRHRLSPGHERRAGHVARRHEPAEPARPAALDGRARGRALRRRRRARRSIKTPTARPTSTASTAPGRSSSPRPARAISTQPSATPAITRSCCACNLGEKDARPQWVEQNLSAGWFPDGEVGKDVEFTTNLPQGAARVRYRAHSDGLARREADELVVPLAPSTTMTSQLAPLVKRTLPVVLPPNTAPSHQTRVIRVLPPPGYKASELAKGGEENGGEFGYAKVEIKVDPENPARRSGQAHGGVRHEHHPAREIRRLARLAPTRRRALTSLGPLLPSSAKPAATSPPRTAGVQHEREEDSQGVWEFGSLFFSSTHPL